MRQPDTQPINSVPICENLRPIYPWLPATLWMAGIFYFSSRPDPLDFIAAGGNKTALGKIAHFSEYAGLYFWLHRALRKSSHTHIASKPSPWWGALLITLLYAIIDELHQRTTPGRNFELSDIAVDLAGALAMLGILCFKDHLAKYNT